MKKRVLGIVAAGAFAVAAISAPVAAYSNGGGNSANAPGQTRATENCVANYTKQQDELGLGDKNKNKPEFGPTNCDHFWTEPI
jgi:hypothetical protein